MMSTSKQNKQTELSPRRGFIFTKWLLTSSLERRLRFLAILLVILNAWLFGSGVYFFILSKTLPLEAKQSLFGFFGHVVAVNVIISFILFIFIVRLKRSKVRIDAIVKMGMEIARGDFTHRVARNDKDEWQPLVLIFNKIIESLQEIIKKFWDTALLIMRLASKIHAVSEQQVSGASEQSSAVAQVTTTMNEFSVTAAHIAEFAESVAKIAEHASSGMQVVTGKVSHNAKKILSLAEKSQSIGKITNLIDSMAGRTNLLALNAAIEAARAGEAGRGFAIVAQEVRKLSESARESTDEIRQLIIEIQADMNSTIMGMEDLTKGVSREFEKVKELAQVAKEIFIAVRQQQNASDQVAQALKNIDVVTKQAVISTKEVVLSVAELNKLSDDLKSTMNKFKLSNLKEPE